MLGALSIRAFTKSVEEGFGEAKLLQVVCSRPSQRGCIPLGRAEERIARGRALALPNVAHALPC